MKKAALFMNKKKMSRLLIKARKKAEKIAHQQKEFNQLLNRATQKAHQQRKRIQQFWEDLQLLIKMIKAYKNGKYREISWKSMITALAAVIYFVNPFDLIPDFLGMFGFLDDATVIGLVISTLKEEIQLFKAYLASTDDPLHPLDSSDDL